MKKPLWRKTETAQHARPFTQKLNPNSLFRAVALSRLAGMERAHVSLVRLPPGKDSFAYHAHMLEEEWIYIISGRAIAEIDGESTEVGAGDFMGFATPSAPHLLRNTFDEECVYLMGGEDKPIDVVAYPKLGKRFLSMQTDKGTELYELGEPQKPFGKAD
ncbi:MAG TPA: cupin domain-containing protein [Caulobacterales bacterium]|nr:cupin domain-containing protein [Caulobacterales bacterium]